MKDLTCLSAEARAKTSVSREEERDLVAKILALPLSLSDLPENCTRVGSCGKTSQALLALGGADFAFIIQELSKNGFGLAWAVLDAQFFGVPQARRRVFIVGHYRDWRPSAAVLFDGAWGGGNCVTTKAQRPKHSAEDTEGALLFDLHGQDASVRQFDHVAPTVTARYGTGGNNVPLTWCQTKDGEKLRALTPEEVEALQGFERGYTAITYRGRKAPKGHRYRVLGNSMAVPVIRWLGQRIELVEEVQKEKETKE